MSILSDRSVRQIIYTKFLSPTPTTGQRVRAIASSGCYVKQWDYDLDATANHNAAAEALADKLGWRSDLLMGQIDTGFVYIPVEQVRDVETN